MTAATHLMPIPGDNIPCPCRAAGAAGRRPDRAGRPVAGRDPRRARSRGPGRQAGEAARQADLALDLQSRGGRFFGDERHRQAAAALVRRALRHLAPGGGRGPGVVRRHAQMAAAARTTATISRWCSSPTPTAAPCACRARSGARSNCPFCHTGTMTAGQEPRAGGNRRPGNARPRRTRRVAEASRKGGC